MDLAFNLLYFPNDCSGFRMTTYFSKTETKKCVDDQAEYELAVPSVRLENG